MASNATSTLSTALAALPSTLAAANTDSSDSLVTSVGHALSSIMKIVPSFLVGLAAFTTLTLPAWLFAGLSTSLTFTVNMTTL